LHYVNKQDKIIKVYFKLFALVKNLHNTRHYRNSLKQIKGGVCGVF